MRQKTIIFDDWRGGEFDELTAQGAPKNSFSGSNVMRYNDGALGPRPGLKLLAPTGVPTGAIWMLCGVGGTNGVVFGNGTSVYGFTATGGAATSLGTVASTPANPVDAIANGSYVEFVSYGDKAYEVNPSGVTVTALTGSPAGKAIGLYGVRMMVANTAANPRRVFYSAAGNFSSWPALNYFDVPALPTGGWGVTYLEELRQRLVIANEGGEWWALTGVPGVNDVLRRQSRGDLAPLSSFHVARMGETAWFLAQNEDFPVLFSGITVDKLRFRHLSFTDSSQTLFGAASLPSQEIVLFTEQAGGGNRGLMLANDVWTQHTFGKSISRYVSAERPPGPLSDVNVPIIVSDGGGVGVAAKFYAFAPALDRPGKTTDTYAQPGDDSTDPVSASFATYEEWESEGRDFVPRTVVVDFHKWNTGSASTNHFDLMVRSLHRLATNSTKDSATYSFDEAGSKTTADRQVDRRVFRVNADRGQGFQIRFSNLRGVAIRKVTVVADVEDRG